MKLSRFLVTFYYVFDILHVQPKYLKIVTTSWFQKLPLFTTFVATCGHLSIFEFRYHYR